MTESILSIDFNQTNGRRIRPLHGVNSGPLTKVFTYDARKEFREAGIPFARLHDVEYPYGSGEFVDVHCIFKNFDADENNPENYSFKLTDLYLEACFEAGAEPLYRLGESIEHAPVKMHIYPPKDYGKWIRILEHVIMHYTEGWADGYRWPITYWEIYNEPDGRGNMWRGTPEEFYELYCQAAVYLKKRFPELKIGGCGFTKPTNEFIEGFFRYLQSYPERVPLDFYSWHLYFSDASKVSAAAKTADELLARYGYPEAESVLDEWNYIRDWNDQPDSYVAMKNEVGASFYAAVLADLQTKTRVGVACLFEADVVKEFCGLFNVGEMWIGNHGRKASMAKTKGFYAFKAYNELYRLGEEIPVLTGAADGRSESVLHAAAAADRTGRFGILIANPSTEAGKLSLKWNEGLSGHAYLTDARCTFGRLPEFDPDEIILPPHSFLYVGNTIRE